MKEKKSKQATRPVFLPNAKAPAGYYQKDVTFDWEYDAKHKQINYRKNSQNMRKKFQDEYNMSLLEVSSASDCPLGKNLSAFNLTITTKNKRVYTVEQLFQAGKVFKKAGSQIGLLKADSKKAKQTTAKIQKTGDKLIGFYLFGQEFPLEPTNLFYDWLYIHALNASELGKYCLEYDGFTDIRFNPEKQLNCQAMACAKYECLVQSNKLDEALKNIKTFQKLVE